MAVIALDEVYLSYSDFPLLDKASMSLEPRERLCIVGRNGAGKSTLLRVLARKINPDSGSAVFAQDLKITMLEQDPPRNIQDSPLEYVLKGNEGVFCILQRYEDALNHPEGTSELAHLQELIDQVGAFDYKLRCQQLLNQMGLPAEGSMQGLSGGMLRRIALVRAIAADPDVLLLDEPTNHLDIASITSLENFLGTFQGAVVFISHDRRFIDEVATRIVELDRGKIYSYPGNYQKYLKNRDYQREIEDKANADFDRKLSAEEVWIRQGIKARRTRNEGRVRDLKKMREERRNRRNRQKNVALSLNEARRSGNLVFTGEHISFSRDNRPLIKDLDILIERQDRIALVGANGCGKTTLVHLLLGDLKPDEGVINQGAGLSIAYFDQYRETLDEEASVMDNLNYGRTEVEINGKRKSVISYLQDFLFEPHRTAVPVKALSGGEKNRLLLARLFLKPFNVLILDEPTNDLDMETLELLEEVLTKFTGTLILVSHDRWFISNTATELWYFREQGNILKVVGGYEELEKELEKSAPSSSPDAVKQESPVKSMVKVKKRLSYKEEKELSELPFTIEKLEEELETLRNLICEPSFYSNPPEEIKKTNQCLSNAEEKLAAAYERWEELEALKESFAEKQV